VELSDILKKCFCYFTSRASLGKKIKKIFFYFFLIFAEKGDWG
jgi:hypothetical protein